MNFKVNILDLLNAPHSILSEARGKYGLILFSLWMHPKEKKKKIGFKIAQASQIKVKRNLHPNALVENDESSMNQQHYFVFSFWTLKYILKQ